MKIAHKIMNLIKFQLAGMMILAICSFVKPVSTHQVKSLTDTSFKANTMLGWNMLSTYLATKGDTVLFELILSRNVPPRANWNDASLVGKVDSIFCPLKEIVIQYLELPRVWQINISPSGDCYFKLLTGPPPQGSTIVLPVQTRYLKE
jgi:hypothetical protein